jgi:hypothetical protein
MSENLPNLLFADNFAIGFDQQLPSLGHPRSQSLLFDLAPRLIAARNLLPLVKEAKRVLRDPRIYLKIDLSRLWLEVQRENFDEERRITR